MAGHLLVVHLAHGGDLAAFGDSSAVADIYAKVVDQFAFYEFAKGPLGVELFAVT